MARIVHLSDLHFGTVVPELVEPLLSEIHQLEPTVIVISGDLTQRARKHQYEEAAAFIARLPSPKLIIPGNHDVPLWNVYNRFLKPLTRFRRYIGTDIEPHYRDDELFIVGINSARSFVFDGGRISYEQMERLESDMQSVNSDVWKIVAIHHPIVPSHEIKGIVAVGRAEKALASMERAGVDMVLAGHAHHRYTLQTARSDEETRSILIVQAGTALSHRIRSTPNSFNVIDTTRNYADVTAYEWDKGRNEFARILCVRFRDRGKWITNPDGCSKE
jgi:3',5'-cyclic AMP phosphodiesterase CpdA